MTRRANMPMGRSPRSAPSRSAHVRSQAARLGGDQHEERLEAYFFVGALGSRASRRRLRHCGRLIEAAAECEMQIDPLAELLALHVEQRDPR